MPGSILFVSTLPAQGREQRFGLAVGAVSLLGLAITAPFARVQLPAAPLFIGLYQSTLAVCDLITMVLLLGQFTMLHLRGLLVLANGYLFTASIAILHGLTFPGLFATDGLLGAGPQTTAWLYMAWHAGFPLAVIFYSLSSPSNRMPVPPRRAMLWAALATLLMVALLAVLTTRFHSVLPAVMTGNRYTNSYLAVVATVWALSAGAFVVLWRKKPRTVLDVWLLVVLFAWNVDIALSAAINGGRFDLGFYAGRIYGLVASSLVLVVLLLETTALYAVLALTNARLRDLANRDGLTGMFNRRYFDERLDTEMMRARRERHALSLLLIDVDHFKQYNDRYGHLQGDECLRTVAASIEAAVRRPADFAARYGGEEFAVLLPNTGRAGAVEVAELIREQLRLAAVPHQGSAASCVTVSIGVGTIKVGEEASGEQLIAVSDQALYRAKDTGRNAVVA